MKLKKKESEMKNWESLIASKSRPCSKICKIEDAGKRNAANATKKWRKKNADHYKATQKAWRDANPDKIKTYQERNKKNVKRWAEEHPERVRELGRMNDRKRAKTPKRIAWTVEYLQRPEVIERRAEQMRKRESNPSRIAWKKAYEEKRKNDPQRIAYRRQYNKRYYERKKKEKELECKL